MSNCRKSCASVVFSLGTERFLYQQQSYGEAFDCDVKNPMFRPVVYFLRKASIQGIVQKTNPEPLTMRITLEREISDDAATKIGVEVGICFGD
ncbi:hypothetical protein AVEN_1194-1 [Araneus ventricosus]|uniref:Uncharacterized protein n=1 Tax=Araneus ventricosus TaxID=182803 RepID=A0A4Y2RNZ6_ARAVE|nr:hypothetical protein AVEN_190144-1 [Araneus ventricosus]GBN77381.1 hypothetical protein AVEN_1194-1 [Araneus ventricosus]